MKTSHDINLESSRPSRGTMDILMLVQLGQTCLATFHAKCLQNQGRKHCKVCVNQLGERDKLKPIYALKPRVLSVLCSQWKVKAKRLGFETANHFEQSEGVKDAQHMYSLPSRTRLIHHVQFNKFAQLSISPL